MIIYSYVIVGIAVVIIIVLNIMHFFPTPTRGLAKIASMPTKWIMDWLYTK